MPPTHSLMYTVEGSACVWFTGCTASPSLTPSLFPACLYALGYPGSLYVYLFHFGFNLPFLKPGGLKSGGRRFVGSFLIFFFFSQSSCENSARLCSSVLRMPPVPTQGPNFAASVWFRASLQSLAAAGFQTCQLSILAVWGKKPPLSLPWKRNPPWLL